MATLHIRSFPVQVPINFAPKRTIVSGRNVACPPGEESGYKPRLTDTFDAMRGEYLHAAMDITAAEGTPIVSATPGTVQKWWRDRPGAGWNDKGGWYVRIIDDDGFAHYYAHMSTKPLVCPGQRVKAGQVIGFVGHTGNALPTCPHLHYSVTHPDGKKVNPFGPLRSLYEGGGWRYRGLTPAEWLVFAIATALLVVAVHADRTARQGL